METISYVMFYTALIFSGIYSLVHMILYRKVLKKMFIVSVYSIFTTLIPFWQCYQLKFVLPYEGWIQICYVILYIFVIFISAYGIWWLRNIYRKQRRSFVKSEIKGTYQKPKMKKPALDMVEKNYYAYDLTMPSQGAVFMYWFYLALLIMFTLREQVYVLAAELFEKYYNLLDQQRNLLFLLINIIGTIVFGTFIATIRGSFEEIRSIQNIKDQYCLMYILDKKQASVFKGVTSDGQFYQGKQILGFYCLCFDIYKTETDKFITNWKKHIGEMKISYRNDPDGEEYIKEQINRMEHTQYKYILEIEDSWLIASFSDKVFEWSKSYAFGEHSRDKIPVYGVILNKDELKHLSKESYFAKRYHKYNKNGEDFATYIKNTNLC